MTLHLSSITWIFHKFLLLMLLLLANTLPYAEAGPGNCEWTKLLLLLILSIHHSTKPAQYWCEMPARKTNRSGANTFARLEFPVFSCRGKGESAVGCCQPQCAGIKFSVNANNKPSRNNPTMAMTMKMPRAKLNFPTLSRSLFLCVLLPLQLPLPASLSLSLSITLYHLHSSALSIYICICISLSMYFAFRLWC